MIADLKPYAEYKESGLQWIGQIPASWQLHRAKFLFREIDERSKTGKEELLSVSHKTGVTPRSQKVVTMFLAKTNVGHKICRPQDLVINTLWAWMAALGVSRHTGLVSPAYGVYRPLAPERFLPHFADLLLRTPTYAAEYQRRSTGVNSSRLRLYPEDFLRIPVLFPSTDEQAAIVLFLAHANCRIERYLRAKKMELALVSEMLINFTQRALQLLGTKAIRLSEVAEVVSRPVDRRPADSYTPVGLYNRGRGIFHKASTDGTQLGDSDFSWVEDGDLVISGQFAWEGAVALARDKDAGCVASHRYPILHGRQEYATSEVLLALLRTPYGTMLLDHHSRGAAGRNRPLNIRTLLKEKVPIPSLSAQARIAELLDQEYSVAQSVAKVVSHINKYRTRLITDVVTGKLDVREAAKNLPAEAEQATLPEEVDEVEVDSGEENGETEE
jgi:type I restriction enzyme, S subunit